MSPPTLQALTILDVMGFVLLIALGALLITTWQRVKQDDRFLLALGLFYLALAGRFAVGWYIKITLAADTLSAGGILLKRDPIWGWSSLIVGILVIATGVYSIWFYVGDSVKAQITAVCRRVLRGPGG